MLSIHWVSINNMWINVNLSKLFLLFIALIAPMWLIAGLITWINDDPTYEVRYDCRQATVRIDYPIEVREKCKKVMKKYDEFVRQNPQ